MATSKNEKVWYVSSEDLKTKYRHGNQENRIGSICKAIGESTRTQVTSQLMSRGTIRFAVIGHKTKRAVETIIVELCLPKAVDKYLRETNIIRQQPTVQLTEQAMKVMSEKDQDKLLAEGNQFLLTEGALRKFDILTGALQLREFACEPCDHFWWKTVPRTKLVSKCPRCQIKYDALPREKEFGTGRYKCTVCKNSFFARCEATSIRQCFSCHSFVRAPYIHPKFIRRSQPAQLALAPEKRVINASTVHDSTGSTESTFISQREYASNFQHQRVPSDVLQVAPYPSDIDSDIPDSVLYGSSSEFESDSERSSVSHESLVELSISDTRSESDTESESDSDSVGPKSPRKRRVSVSSSSDSDSDTDKEDDEGRAQRQQSQTLLSDEDSIHSAASDSGLGTALETGSSTATKSSDGSYQGSLPSTKLGSIVGFLTDFPGIVFSKHCARRTVGNDGATIKGEGIQLEVPKNALVPGDSIEIELHGCLGGPFILPEDVVLVSPVYRLAPPCAFREDVVLTIEHFGVLESPEDCDEIVFITSPTKPRIRDQAYWKFCVYNKVQLKCEIGSQYVNLLLRHFCLGGVARRKMRGQKHRYCATLHSPIRYGPPCCNAIFSVTLHHELYMQNLQRFLDKTFSNQELYPLLSRVVKSIEGEIALKLPEELARSQGYRILTHTECKILKEEVDYGLKSKKRAQSDIIGYPPRILLTLQQLNSQATLDCRIEVSGIREVPFINLHILPVPHTAPTVQMPELEEREHENELRMGDLNDIICYLHDMDTKQLRSLGLAFGLHHPNISKMEHFPNDLVAAWLRREENVCLQCPPSWRNLVKALEEINQIGIATDVRRDHL